jgi:hypothetical protein
MMVLESENALKIALLVSSEILAGTALSTAQAAPERLNIVTNAPYKTTTQ